MAQPLSEAERKELLPALDGWTMVEGRDAIAKTFRITGLDGVFTIVNTLDEAFNGDTVGA